MHSRNTFLRPAWVVLSVAVAAMLSGTAHADEPPPAWLLQPHPDAIEHFDRSCESFQMFAAGKGDNALSWIGTMDPGVCRDFVNLREPAIVEQLNRFWRDSLQDCIAEGLSGDECRQRGERLQAEQRTDRLIGFFLIPAWACAIEARRRDERYLVGLCVVADVPVQDTELWSSLLAAAYVGINWALSNDIKICDDEADSRPLLPFAASAFPLAPRGEAVSEIERRLAALDFQCTADVRDGTTRRCELELFGHRWQLKPDVPGGMYTLGLADFLRISLKPAADGRNQRTCATIISVGL